ncbi:M48 family metallopeptidase [Acinetobacter sp. CFCC 10889]|uniref:M48 family metallopeptidase n=1 Tax=Acinetobacter sp. CFCC 10889 TaxID=1775557 RepID=UPI001D18D6DB|nr:M48 family metalloprotease [Acinetobacter sp. CFCC 10889]
MKKILLTLGLSLSCSVNAIEDFYPTHTPHLEVPDIGGGVGFIDQQKEKMIGEKVYREVQHQMPIVQNPWLEDQFMTVFSRILSQTQVGSPVGLVIVKDPQINAFAVPGGLFALNTGMVTSSKNMDEVVGVMAHEIAHVTQRHYSRSQEAFKGQGLLALAGIIVGAALASKADGDVGGAVMLGSQAALMGQQLSYSRNQEREADRIGMQFMYGAGYNPQSMADFFETMHRATSRLSFMPDFWLTHPLTSERMSEARLRANQFPKVPFNNNQQEFDLIKWYTAAVSGQTSQQQLDTLIQRNSFAGLLAASEFNLQQGDYVKAQGYLNTAKKINSDYTLLNIIQTDVYLGQNKIEDAYQTIINKQRIMPENRALSYKLAEVCIRQNKGLEAEKLVNRFVIKNKTDILGWQLLQQAANLDKNNPMRTVNVLRNRAEVQYWSGDEDNAIRSLLHAQRLAKDNNAMSARIDTRLKVMQDERKLKI